VSVNLLKDRVADVSDFIEAIGSVARGGTVLDPEVLFITPGVVEKHVASIFAKLGLPPSDSDNRRVIAAIRYLEGR
jgi:hypothetical protein